MATTRDEAPGRHGRQFEQQTTDGTGSAASVGAGGTGNQQGAGGRDGAAVPPGGRQAADAGSRQAGRTDDLLAGATPDAQDDHGFGAGSADEGGAARGTAKPARPAS